MTLAPGTRLGSYEVLSALGPYETQSPSGAEPLRPGPESTSRMI
jgi:hypothetical protein